MFVFFKNYIEKNQNKTHLDEGSIRVRGQGIKADDFWDRFQRAVDPPAPQNGPHLWKSYACISYYLALVPPCIYSTIVREAFKNVLADFVR